MAMQKLLSPQNVNQPDWHIQIRTLNSKIKYCLVSEEGHLTCDHQSIARCCTGNRDELPGTGQRLIRPERYGTRGLDSLIKVGKSSYGWILRPDSPLTGTPEPDSEGG